MEVDAPTIAVTPPESLVRFDAPLFVGVEPNADTLVSLLNKTSLSENASKLDDMINSMLPPR